MDALLIELAAKVITSGAGGRAANALAKLVREKFAENPGRASVLSEAEARPDDPVVRQRLEQELLDVIVVDRDFAGDLVHLVAASELGDDEPIKTPLSDEPKTASPVRGFPGLTVAAASAQTTAGSDFSIFVLVQNPFDVPITVHQVQTHIPVELVDVNQLRARIAKLAESGTDKPSRLGAVWTRYWQRKALRREHPGVATAVGTEFNPEVAKQLFRSEVAIHRDLNIQNSTASFSAVSLVLPKGASSDELDAVMRRIVDYNRGVLPIKLQPGDSVVRQFVLRTRSRLFFRPLSHDFQIQVNYAVDGVDHTGTIPYQLSIQAAIGSIAWGSVFGAALGTMVKTFGSSPGPITLWDGASTLAVSVMAAVAVVIAFARKNSAQPLVSIEDFWGGLVIGFSVGYFGFDKFMNVLPQGG